MAFQIKPNRKETENKTIRFPIPLIEQIEKAIQGQEVTFSRFVIQACEYALNNIEDKKKDSKQMLSFNFNIKISFLLFQL